MAPTLVTPSMFSEPLFWFTHFSSMTRVRACSASTVAIMVRSARLSAASAGAGTRSESAASAASGEKRDTWRQLSAASAVRNQVTGKKRCPTDILFGYLSANSIDRRDDQ